MTASLWTTKSKVMDSTSGQTAESTKAGGIKVSNMASASTRAAKRTRNSGFGNTESALLGSMRPK